MTENEKKLYELLQLDERIISDLIEALQHFIDCEGLPCISLINEAVGLRNEVIKSEAENGFQV